MPDSLVVPKKATALVERLAAQLVPVVPDLVDAIDADAAAWTSLCDELKARWPEDAARYFATPFEDVERAVASQLSVDALPALHELQRRLEQEGLIREQAAYLVGVSVGRRLR